MGVKNIFSFFVLLFSLFLCGQTIEENEIQYDSIVSHEVQKKETLFSISKIYGISVEDLLKFLMMKHQKSMMLNGLHKEQYILM